MCSLTPHPSTDGAKRLYCPLIIATGLLWRDLARITDATPRRQRDHCPNKREKNSDYKSTLQNIKSKVSPQQGLLGLIIELRRALIAPHQWAV